MFSSCSNSWIHQERLQGQRLRTACGKGVWRVLGSRVYSDHGHESLEGWYKLLILYSLFLSCILCKLAKSPPFTWTTAFQPSFWVFHASEKLIFFRERQHYREFVRTCLLESCACRCWTHLKTRTHTTRACTCTIRWWTHSLMNKPEVTWWRNALISKPTLGNCCNFAVWVAYICFYSREGTHLESNAFLLQALFIFIFIFIPASDV